MKQLARLVIDDLINARTSSTITLDGVDALLDQLVEETFTQRP